MATSEERYDDDDLSENDEIVSVAKKEKRAFQVSPSRQEVNDISIIKPGDHICWHREYQIWHHAIVSEVDVRSRKLRVIHYTKNVKKSICVLEEWIYVDKQNGLLYKIDYEEKVTKARGPEMVIAYARKFIGEGNYKLFRNNCEHFAVMCKTGDAESQQVRWLAGKVIETAHTNGVNAAKSTATFVLFKLQNGIGKVVRAVGVGASSVIGGLVVATVEIGHCTYDVVQINKKRKTGEMSKKESKREVTQRIAETGVTVPASIGLGVAGTFVGGIVGSVVPVVGNIAGAAVGGAIGSVAGSVVGKVVGVFVGRRIRSAQR